MKGYVYILYSKRLNKYYIGSSNDVERRFEEHNRGKSKFTKLGIPWELKFISSIEKPQQAKKEEFKIKKKKSRKYLEYLINGNSNEILKTD